MLEICMYIGTYINIHGCLHNSELTDAFFISQSLENIFCVAGGTFIGDVFAVRNRDDCR